MAYILGRPQLAYQPSRIDKYISVEQHPEQEQSRGHSVEDKVPSYRRPDEVSYIRIGNDNARAQSSKRVLPDQISKKKLRDYSVQPRYNANSNYIIQRELERQRAAMSVDKGSSREAARYLKDPPRLASRVLQMQRGEQGISIERYKNNKGLAQVIRRPEYYARVNQASYKYQQPEWWG